MCGILGLHGKISKEKEYWFLTQGLAALQVRGQDATGIYSSSLRTVIKAPIEAKKFLEDMTVKKFLKRTIESNDKKQVVLAHARAWTSGSPKDNNNNHPLFNKKVVLIHNGVIKAEKVKEFPYKGETDSELLLAHIDSSQKKDEPEKLVDAIKKVSGSLAIATYFIETGNLYLYRHSNPIFVGKKGQAVLFSSTAEILNKGISKFSKHFFKGVEVSSIEENTLYQVKGGQLIVHKTNVKPHVQVYNGYGSRYGTYTSYGSAYGYGKDDLFSEKKSSETKDNTGSEDHKLPLFCKGCAFNKYDMYCALKEDTESGHCKLKKGKAFFHERKNMPRYLRRKVTEVLKMKPGDEISLSVKDKVISISRLEHVGFLSPDDSATFSVVVDSLVKKRVYYSKYNESKFNLEMYQLIYGDPYADPDFNWIVDDCDLPYYGT